jgi:hypothetical protein
VNNLVKELGSDDDGNDDCGSDDCSKDVNGFCWALLLFPSSYALKIWLGIKP